ncbi:MAG: hypothetical protein K0S61_1922, partial [Anaerocolumna sp.]|nr:hypothetical protein [Anaerocolumna sp.]
QSYQLDKAVATPKDYFAGLANALDDNITSGALRGCWEKC